MKKIGTVLKYALLLFGIGGIIGGLFDSSLSTENRTFYIIAGLMLCAVALVSVIQWALISVISFSVGAAGVPRIVTDGQFAVSWLLTVAICFVLAVYFGHKVYKRINFHRVRSVSRTTLQHIDLMSGLEFEEFTARLLKKLGYTNVSVTKASGDQGIDVLAKKGGVKYAIQCKNYSNKLDNTPVQEAYAGKDFYSCDVGVVITNSTFTEGAHKLADSIGILLWDRSTLQEMIYRAGKKQLPSTKLTSSNAEKNSTEEPLETHVSSALQAPITSAAEPFTKQSQLIPRTSTESLLRNFANGINDEMLPAAVDVILGTGQASVSMLQRCLKLGYARAARIVDEMEEKGIVGPFRGSTPREILISAAQWELLCSGNEFQHKPISDYDQFIAEAQWYAARGGADLTDNE